MVIFITIIFATEKYEWTSKSKTALKNRMIAFFINLRFNIILPIKTFNSLYNLENFKTLIDNNCNIPVWYFVIKLLLVRENVKVGD